MQTEADECYQYPPHEMEGWKTYPVRLTGLHLSECHQQPMLLVHSLEKGFVTLNCSECFSSFPLSRAEFFGLALWVGCPKCKRRMEHRMVHARVGEKLRAGNYGFYCACCRISVLLADILPKWQDVQTSKPVYHVRGDVLEEQEAVSLLDAYDFAGKAPLPVGGPARTEAIAAQLSALVSWWDALAVQCKEVVDSLKPGRTEGDNTTDGP